jgi:hypothetical protein
MEMVLIEIFAIILLLAFAIIFSFIFSIVMFLCCVGIGLKKVEKDIIDPDPDSEKFIAIGYVSHSVEEIDDEVSK